MQAPDPLNPHLVRVFTTVILSEQSPTSATTPYLSGYMEMVWSNTDDSWRVESIKERVGGE